MMCKMAVEQKKASSTFERSCFSSCWVSSHPPHEKKKLTGITGLVNGDPTMKQIVRGYLVPVAHWATWYIYADIYRNT